MVPDVVPNRFLVVRAGVSTGRVQNVFHRYEFAGLALISSAVHQHLERISQRFTGDEQIRRIRTIEHQPRFELLHGTRALERERRPHRPEESGGQISHVA